MCIYVCVCLCVDECMHERMNEQHMTPRGNIPHISHAYAHGVHDIDAPNLPPQFVSNDTICMHACAHEYMHTSIHHMQIRTHTTQQQHTHIQAFIKINARHTTEHRTPIRHMYNPPLAQAHRHANPHMARHVDTHM